MGAGENGCTLAHGFDRVLSAAVHERSADEGHGREFVEHAEFADRVGNVGVAGPVRQGAERTAGHAETLTLEQLADRRAALRMRGAMMVHKSGMVWRSWQCASATMASSPSCVLAATSSVRPCNAGLRRSSSAMLIGGGGVSTLEIARANALGRLAS